MMSTLDYSINKYSIDANAVSPILIPDFKRVELAKLFGELKFKIGAEVGVERGLYSEQICQSNPGVKLYCIDPWETYSECSEYNNQPRLDEYYNQAKIRLAPYKCEFIKKYSLDTVKDFSPESLDFVYIDANHDLNHVTEDIAAWAEVVKSGGIVAGHDCHFKRKDQGQPAKQAIDTYVKEHKIRMLFLVNQNYQTSWFFIKNE